MNKPNLKQFFAPVILFLMLMGTLIVAYIFKPVRILDLGEISELYDKKWIFHYAIKDGQKILDADEYSRNYSDLEPEIWIMYASDDSKHKNCTQFYTPDENVTEELTCIAGYDGCNNFSVHMNLANDQFPKTIYLSTTTLGCPTKDIMVDQDNPTTLINENLVWDSDIFLSAIASQTSAIIQGDSLKLFNSQTPVDFLFFTQSEK